MVDVVAKRTARMKRREEKIKTLGEERVPEEEMHDTPKNAKEEKIEAKKKEVKETVKVAKKTQAKKEK